jgi:hypothetical protein
MIALNEWFKRVGLSRVRSCASLSLLAALAPWLIAASIAYSEDLQSWIVTDSGCKVFAPHPFADLKVSWSGRCSNGFAEGEGTLTWNNGDVQQGTLRAGRLEGVLTEHWSNGNRYEGEVHASLLTGKGKYYWANGDWYEGDFKDGHRDGVGTQYFGCSGRYQGDFHNGMMDGIGTFYLANGDRYEGDVHGGVMDGVGTFYRAHGNRYAGTVHNGAVEGLGVLYFKDGTRYEGEFKGGRQEGLGTLVQSNGARFEGEFKADRLDGQELVTNAGGDRYQGVYADGHADGPGILTKANGERDAAIFKENRGDLVLVSRLSPRHYEECHEYCNGTLVGCDGVVGTMTAVGQPGRPDLSLARASECANEIAQCVDSCKHHNPTVGSVKGVIEFEEYKPDGDAQASQAINETKEIVTKQVAATAALEARLEQQHQQLRNLQQLVADHHPAIAKPSDAAFAAKCRQTPPRT